MSNEELIEALRWCQKRGCSKCVALLDNGSCKYGGAIKIFDATADALEEAEKRIAELMPKEGEWIEDEYGYIHCSRCGMEWDEPEHPNTKYCPNCGAKMKGAE